MAALSILIIVAFAFLTMIRADLIRNVCIKTSNPSFCNKELRLDPRSKGADLTLLGKIALQKAILESHVAIATVKSRVHGGAVDDCVEAIGDMILVLKKCNNWLPPRNKNEVGNLLTKGWEAIIDINACNDSFINHDPPAKVKAATHRARDFIEILLAVANTF